MEPAASALAPVVVYPPMTAGPAVRRIVPPSPPRGERALPEASSGRIIRPLFQPLRLAPLLSGLLAREGVEGTAPWVVAAAERLLHHAARSAPSRWLAELASAFPRSDAAAVSACRRALDGGLPDAAWTSDALLGEVLLTARRLPARRHATARTGRAGRRSVCEVYTPPSLAEQMVAAVQVGPRRMLDPACGAGVFLVTAFRRAFQRRTATGQDAREAARGALTHEISGIDLDREALALARFSLRLAAWEAAGLDEDLPLDLRRADALGPLPGLEGRFDVVIGNPPFVEGRGLTRPYQAWLRACFRSAATGKVNLFAVFVERGLSLIREGGILSFILPATLLRNERYLALRVLLLEHALEAITPVAPGAFEGRVVETVILRVRKRRPGRAWKVDLPGGPTPQHRLALGPALRFCPRATGEVRRQIERMEGRGRPLETLFAVRDGISTGFQPFPQRLLGRVVDEAFVADDGTRAPFDPGRHVRIMDGREFHAFTPIRWEGRWLEYDKTHEHHPPHPGRPFNCQLREREIFDRPEKLVTRQTARGLIATVDRARFFARNSVHVTYPLDAGAGLSLAALCACLNSAFYRRYFLAVTGEDGEVFPQVHVADIRRLPILPEALRRGGRLHALGEELLARHGDPRGAGSLALLLAAVEEALGAAFAG